MNKKVIILIGILFLAVFVVIFFLNVLLENQETNTPTPTTTPTTEPTPTKAPSPTPEPNELTVNSILPDSSTGTSLLPHQKITIEFNDPVNAQDIAIEVSPFTETNIIGGDAPNEIYILPSSVWPEGTTNITILQSTTSTTGKRLTEPFNYSITTALPTLPPEELNEDYP